LTGDRQVYDAGLRQAQIFPVMPLWTAGHLIRSVAVDAEAAFAKIGEFDPA
jgi:hypothetical protein